MLLMAAKVVMDAEGRASLQLVGSLAMPEVAAPHFCRPALALALAALVGKDSSAVPNLACFMHHRNCLAGCIYCYACPYGLVSHAQVVLLQAACGAVLQISSKQLRDDLMTMLIAGHETTAAVLTWTVYCLTSHPEVVARVHSEASQAVLLAKFLSCL